MNSERRPRLQIVQPPDVGHVSLPTSVQMSADGEEGALVYNRRLLQSNINAMAVRREGQQIPPNRTIPRDCATMCDDRLMLDSQITSTTTSQHHKKQSSATVDAVGLTPVRHATVSGRYGRDMSGDYVSSSELSDWCGMLPCENRPMPPLPTSYYDQSSDAAAATKPAATKNLAESERSRSSSADSICRRFLRFTRKLTTKSTSKRPPTPPLVLSADSSCAKLGDFLDDGSSSVCGGGLKGDDSLLVGSSSSHWELPPNYVDMIFTKTASASTEKHSTSSSSSTLVKGHPATGASRIASGSRKPKV